MNIFQNLGNKVLESFVSEFGTENWTKLTPDEKLKITQASATLVELLARQAAGEDVSKDVKVVSAILQNFLTVGEINITETLTTIASNLFLQAAGKLILLL